jgi:hypothetical protein
VAVPLSDITIIASSDEQTNEAGPKSKETAQFIDALYPNVVAKLNGPIGSTSLPTDSIHKSV